MKDPFLRWQTAVLLKLKYACACLRPCGTVAPAVGAGSLHFSQALLVPGPRFKQRVQTESWLSVEMSLSNQFKILS